MGGNRSNFRLDSSARENESVTSKMFWAHHKCYKKMYVCVCVTAFIKGAHAVLVLTDGIYLEQECFGLRRSRALPAFSFLPFSINFIFLQHSIRGSQRPSSVTFFHAQTMTVRYSDRHNQPRERRYENPQYTPKKSFGIFFFKLKNRENKREKQFFLFWRDWMALKKKNKCLSKIKGKENLRYYYGFNFF